MKITSRVITWPDGRKTTDGRPPRDPPPKVEPKPMGLGDAVAVFADPIARVSDALFGTSFGGCGGCAQRRAKLNKLMPDVGLNKSDSPTPPKSSTP